MSEAKYGVFKRCFAASLIKFSYSFNVWLMFDIKEMDTVSRNIRQIIGARPGWRAMYFKGDAFYTEEICAWVVMEDDSIVGQVANEWVGFADEAVRPDYTFTGYLSPEEWIDDAGIIHNTQGIWAVKRLFRWLLGKEGSS